MIKVFSVTPLLRLCNMGVFWGGGRGGSGLPQNFKRGEEKREKREKDEKRRKEGKISKKFKDLTKFKHFYNLGGGGILKGDNKNS